MPRFTLAPRKMQSEQGEGRAKHGCLAKKIPRRPAEQPLVVGGDVPAVDVVPPEAAPLARITRRVKAAFDPQGLLNPGKNIPTLHRCAEFGSMHVHHGALPFPEVERF